MRKSLAFEPFFSLLIDALLKKFNPQPISGIKVLHTIYLYISMHIEAAEIYVYRILLSILSSIKDAVLYCSALKNHQSQFRAAR